MKKQYILSTLLACSYFGANSSNPIKNENNRTQRKPNILFIITDQQQASMMSCTGNTFVKTPNLDELANSGIRFEKAYATNPVCVPSRFSIMTGLMPSLANAESNTLLNKPISKDLLINAMGNTFRNEGYQTVYGGKIHLPGTSKESIENVLLYGFDNISIDYREKLAHTCSDFIKQKHDKPFLMVASFMNPHDICYMAVNYWREQTKNGKPNFGEPWKTLQQALKIPKGISEKDFFDKICPPLPSNFEIPHNEIPDAVGLNAEFMKYVRNNWGEKEWRLHRWAYKNLTELVDKEIGEILTALKESELEDNTIIIFTSDHGDMDASHRLEHKSLFYEESVHVPFVIKWKGVIRPGLIDKNHLVMTGLDIIPTMCDFAGIPLPTNPEGMSLEKIATGEKEIKPRDFIVSETQNARMVFDGKWKYMVSGNSGNDEMLFNLETDPGEMENIGQLDQYSSQLKQCRELLISWYKEHEVPLDQKYIKK